MGLVFFGLIGFAVFLIFGIIFYYTFKSSAFVRKLAIKIKDIIFFNTILRTLIQGYLTFTVAAFLSFLSLDFSATTLLRISSVMTITFASVFTLFPFALLWFLHNYQYKFPREDFTRKFGTIYQG